MSNDTSTQRKIFEGSEKGKLFEMLCSKAQLKMGFKAVKRNGGSVGIDKQTIKDFESNLDNELTQLKKELSTWTYKPQPVRRVEIPKPDGGLRMLGIPCIRDRVVQATMKQILEPILDPQFSEHSYGFRPGKNQQKAITAAQKIVKEEGKDFVVDIDLSKFFDRIHHDRLLYRLGQKIPDNRILRIVGMTLRSGVMANGVITETTEGSVQGSPLSPLLSNLVLDELDKELESRGLSFCRFADDCNIFVKTRKAGERVMASVRKFIEKKLKLVVNEDKSKVARSSEVKFLGFTVVHGTIAISKKAMQKAMDRVKTLTKRGTALKMEDAIRAINKWYVGWSSYYKVTQYPAQLQKIEAHIRRRLRARIISQQKRRRFLAKLLIKQGVSKGSSWRTVYTNRKRWALSRTRAIEKAFSNDWFSNKGLFLRSKEDHAHWFHINKWVRLT